LLLFLLLAASACERDPMARTDDLWPGFHRAAATEFPTADEIELGCGQASAHFKEEAEKTPGTYVDPELADFPVRNPLCRWEEGSASTALCRFEQTMIAWGDPSDKPRQEILAELKDRDWDPLRVRMVRVKGPSDSRWIAPAGCERLPAG
jgi:hypothetical protein